MEKKSLSGNSLRKPEISSDSNILSLLKLETQEINSRNSQHKADFLTVFTFDFAHFEVHFSCSVGVPRSDSILASRLITRFSAFLRTSLQKDHHSCTSNVISEESIRVFAVFRYTASEIVKGGKGFCQDIIRGEKRRRDGMGLALKKRNNKKFICTPHSSSEL